MLTHNHRAAIDDSLAAPRRVVFVGRESPLVTRGGVLDGSTVGDHVMGLQHYCGRFNQHGMDSVKVGTVISWGIHLFICGSSSTAGEFHTTVAMMRSLNPSRPPQMTRSPNPSRPPQLRPYVCIGAEHDRPSAVGAVACITPCGSVGIVARIRRIAP